VIANVRIGGNALALLGEQYVQDTWFTVIDSQSGSIGTAESQVGHASAAFVMDAWPNGVDAVVSAIGSDDRPTFEPVIDAGSGAIVTVDTFLADGSFVLSHTPVGNIALVFRYHVKRLYYADAYSLGDFDLEPVGGTGVSAHGDLTGLDLDQHPGYLWGLGRVGGQTLLGGIASGENITLESTSHATKGLVILNGPARALTLDLTQATGTAPLTVVSATLIANLNADLIDGLHASNFAVAGHNHHHSALMYLTEDDHTQYHNDTRGDVRYFQRTEFLATSAGAADAGKPVKLDADGQIDATMLNDGDIAHSGLAGLTTGDPHNQYALLAGRSGGQALNGGTAASESLTLDSTTNATKGNLLLQPSDGRIGVGTTTPEDKIDIRVAAHEYLRIRSNANGSVQGLMMEEFRSTKERRCLLSFYKSASDTIGTYSETVSGEYLGQIDARGVNSSGATANSATIQFLQGAAATADLVPGRIHFITSDATIGLQNRLVIDSNGCFLTGGLISNTTGSTNAFILKAGNAPTSSIADSTHLWVADRGGTAGRAGLHIRSENGTSHVFSDYSGIATTTPKAALEVIGSINVDYSASAGTSGTSMRLNTNANVTYVDTNIYYNAAFKYSRDGGATQIISQVMDTANGDPGDIYFNTAPSGLADATATMTTRLKISQTGNLLMGGAAAGGTNAAEVFVFGAGTPPTTSPADAGQMWVEDIQGVGGAAGLHFRNENTADNMIVPGVVIKSTTGDLGYQYQGLICINLTDNNIRMYADGGWRTIASW
jgi:hypothetical protein